MMRVKTKEQLEEGKIYEVIEYDDGGKAVLFRETSWECDCGCREA